MSRRDRRAKASRNRARPVPSDAAEGALLITQALMEHAKKDGVPRVVNVLGEDALAAFVSRQTALGRMVDGRAVPEKTAELIEGVRDLIDQGVKEGRLKFNVDVDNPLDPDGTANPFYMLGPDARASLKSMYAAEVADQLGEMHFGIPTMHNLQEKLDVARRKLKEVSREHAEKTEQLNGLTTEFRTLLHASAAEHLEKMIEAGLDISPSGEGYEQVRRDSTGKARALLVQRIVDTIREQEIASEPIDHLFATTEHIANDPDAGKLKEVLTREFESVLAELIFERRYKLHEIAGEVFRAGSYKDFKSKGTIWGDADLTRLGVQIWNATYRVGGGDPEAAAEAQRVAEAWLELAQGDGQRAAPTRGHVIQSLAMFAAKWAVHAFQRVTTSHTFGSALMCSDVDPNHLRDIEIQWHAFMVVLPNDLLGYDDPETGRCFYTRLLVACHDKGATLVLLNQAPSDAQNRIVVMRQPDLAALLDTDDKQAVLEHTTESITSAREGKVRRVVVMAKRLVAGLLLAMQNQDNFRERKVRGAGQHRWRDPGAEPEHRIVFVGKPITIDCRASIKEYVEHGPSRKGRPPSVQTLVRGFFRRQVVSVGRSGRKVIWIEPFWRGPKDAPIFTRPKRVG